MSLRRRGILATRGGAFADAVWDATLSPSSVMYVQRVSATEYNLITNIGRGREVHWGLIQSIPGNSHHMQAINTYWPVLSIGYADASVARTGTWTLAGGQYRSTTAGNYYEWTTPAATTCVGLSATFATNGGFGRVLINGDADAATGLKTAQEYVDAGALASTALVSGGGTLNPTDRLFDYYSVSSSERRTMLADDLAAGAHVVRVEVTGYKRAAASEARVMCRNHYYGGSTITNFSTPSVIMVEHKRILNAITSFEFAYSVWPTGMTTAAREWVGNSHGNEVQSALTFEVDGVPVAMSVDGDVESGSSIVISRTSTLRHPDVGAGATPIANVDLTYTFDQQGLKIAHTTEWLTSMETDGDGCYPSMFSVTETAGNVLYETFHRGSGSGVAVDFDLSVSDNAYHVFGNTADAHTAWMWSPGGDIVAAVRVDDVMGLCDDFQFSGSLDASIEDRTGGLLNKVYFTRVASFGTIGGATAPTATNGTIWTSAGTTHRVSSVVDADAICSRGL